MSGTDLNAILDDIRPTVMASLEKNLANRVADALSYSVRDEIQAITSAYIAEHVLPAVTEQLTAQKDEMVLTIVAAVKASMDSLADALVEKATTKVSQSWTVGKFARDLFA